MQFGGFTILPLILASSSPFRRQLLRDAGLEVALAVPGVEEPDLATFPDLEAGLAYLALLKARAVAAQGVTGLILACDTTSLVAGQILAKPLDRTDAGRMIGLLSGSRHEVLTGWCLLRSTDGLTVGGVERTTIVMRSWSPAEIDAYLDSGQWEGKCGGYGIETDGDRYVTGIEGSLANVVGVPLERIQAVLREFPSLQQTPSPP